MASRTQQSTQEIQEMIVRLQGGAKEAVAAMDRGQEKAQTMVSISWVIRENWVRP